MRPDPPRLARRDGDSAGKLSTSTIIIIAVVCASVVFLVFALFLWRNLARSCRRSRKVPLPPVQDLAHHREQQLSAFADRAAASRPPTWADPSMLHPRAYSAHFLSASASNASLIRHSSDLPSRPPTRENSWAVESVPSAEGSPSPNASPLSTDDLRAPNPSYFAVGAATPHTSMMSVASDSSDALVTSPSDITHSAESSASLVHNAAAPARPRPPRGSRSRSRPLSLVSSAHSVHTSRSMNTLRGPAHSIHSNIQIVLPAPLAPELYPAAPQPQPPPADDRISAFGAPRAGSFYGFAAAAEGDRRSVADPWLAGAQSQSRTSLRMEREGSGSRAASGSGLSSRHVASRRSAPQGTHAPHPGPGPRRAPGAASTKSRAPRP
ncbi:hypothetical protein C8Q78DRAFT_168281 [Trametes maxima]|nr:hypothetical protein C8Q78DRAFT_168281 [Trametes maxima]